MIGRILVGMADVVSISGLHKHFGRLHAVDGVDMTVTGGEIFGFLGPNGAGKSTTIRVMMGFIRPTAGAVTIFGYDMAQSAERAKRRIGYLPGNSLRHFSIFNYFNGGELLARAAYSSHMLVALGGMTLTLFAFSLWWFNRRDYSA